ncbi:hypothetical protein BKA67DRAFT_641088 [Truncatella angustata]|uniref:Rhodopsin domain-containing protein n=1 Tax=Truncatella angustata TaxID=152316 RepID=A0A9P9A395_9PEZI|nr:uncharacterized protein BKA67DRAFT_641088 [Truncatella angustata]KAH6659913.1 hypothetical protein BKA67DRAFT_641088 [Truncatella angustata]
MGLDSTFSTSNFDEPEPWSNKKPVILGLIITFLVSSWLCVCGRLYVRIKIIREPGWDDLCVLLYALFTTLGSHYLLLSADQMHIYLKMFYLCNASYCTATTFIKGALLLQYLRVFPRSSVIWRFTLGTAIFTAVWGLAYSFIAWVPCFPVRSFWEAPADAKCYGYGSSIPSQFVGTYESHTAINMILDFIVLIIPLPLLWKEGTNLKQRMRVLGLLIMGSLVIMLAIWRLATIIDHQAATWPTHDPTWYGPISIILAVLEVDFAAICASTPIFWPVLEERWGSIFITQEIKITREDRYTDVDDRFSTRSGRPGSQIELKRTESGHSQGADAHYNDMFVMSSVDPLRSPKLGESRAAAVIESGNGKKGGGSKWAL